MLDRIRFRLLVIAITLTPLATKADAQTREEIVRSDKEKVESEGFWIYNDLPAAFAEAEETGKPIVVVLRCLPCHECVKLDDNLVDTDPVIRPLLEQFVCVRQVSTNGLDLNVFQYDTDQSFAVFFLNADKTIYGRFGTRSHRTEWVGDVSLKGLAKALEGALALHKNYDRVKDLLAGKTGQPLEVAAPELYPSLKDKFTSSLNYEGDVVKSCIHCHQIGDAQREFYWHAKKPIPDQIVWPYPHPKSVGLTLDPNSRSTVKEVVPETAADRAGFQPGDVIQLADRQPILSIADIQWVLHSADPSGATVDFRVIRGDKPIDLQMQLDSGWRRNSDISWRVTTWGLRRIAAGGMVLEAASESDRKRLSIDDHKMALKVKRVGKYGPHATAKRTGIREGDVIVSYDGRDDLMNEQDLLTYVVTEKQFGRKAKIDLYRGDDRMTFALPIQR